jgi:hypothetical protein
MFYNFRWLIMTFVLNICQFKTPLEEFKKCFILNNLGKFFKEEKNKKDENS